MERCCIIKDKNDIEYGIRKMLDRYWDIREKLNKSYAYTNAETEERINLIKEREILQNYLRMLNIQDFEIKSEWLVFNIN